MQTISLPVLEAGEYAGGIEVSLGTSQLDTGLGAFFGSRHELFVNYFDRAYRT